MAVLVEGVVDLNDDFLSSQGGGGVASNPDSWFGAKPVLLAYVLIRHCEHASYALIVPLLFIGSPVTRT